MEGDEERRGEEVRNGEEERRGKASGREGGKKGCVCVIRDAVSRGSPQR